MNETQDLSLSAAIREGSRLVPQAFGRYRDYGPGRRLIGACALGAAACALDLDGDRGLSDVLARRFPLLNQDVEAPPCGCRPVPAPWTVGLVVTHLNDEHQWRRTTIAAWVASLERK